MAFEEEHFDEYSFWATLIEKVKIALGKIRKAISIRLTTRKTMNVDMTPEGRHPISKNLKVSLRIKKNMTITLRRIE